MGFFLLLKFRHDFLIQCEIDVELYLREFIDMKFVTLFKFKQYDLYVIQVILEQQLIFISACLFVSIASCAIGLLMFV